MMDYMMMLSKRGERGASRRVREKERVCVCVCVLVCLWPEKEREDVRCEIRIRKWESGREEGEKKRGRERKRGGMRKRDEVTTCGEEGKGLRV